jgi:drug/metabolite transporter (DMT)-like permease
MAIAGLALIWGVSFLLIKIAVRGMSPTSLVLIRGLAGCLALALIMRVVGRTLFSDGWRGRIIPFALTRNSLLTPCAVFWGVILVHESLSVSIVVGMLVILAGIVLTNVGRRAVSAQRPESETAAA